MGTGGEKKPIARINVHITAVNRQVPQHIVLSESLGCGSHSQGERFQKEKEQGESGGEDTRWGG